VAYLVLLRGLIIFHPYLLLLVRWASSGVLGMEAESCKRPSLWSLTKQREVTHNNEFVEEDIVSYLVKQTMRMTCKAKPRAAIEPDPSCSYCSSSRTSWWFVGWKAVSDRTCAKLKMVYTDVAPSKLYNRERKLSKQPWATRNILFQLWGTRWNRNSGKGIRSSK